MRLGCASRSEGCTGSSCLGNITGNTSGWAWRKIRGHPQSWLGFIRSRPQRWRRIRRGRKQGLGLGHEAGDELGKELESSDVAVSERIDRRAQRRMAKRFENVMNAGEDQVV
jgi:hypothetical protein